MAYRQRPISPLDAAALERLALRYVERFSTTRAKLTAYLTRKIRERGWKGVSSDPAALAERLASLGYIDDRLFAEAKARSMARRGLGARRVHDALRQAGVLSEDAAIVAPTSSAARMDTALVFARKRRIGPFADEPSDRARATKNVAAMVRAGHAPDIAWKIARMAPGETVEILFETDE